VAFSPKIARVARGIRMQVPLFGVGRETALKVYQDAYAGTKVQVDESLPSRIPVDEWAFREGACLRVFDQPSGCLVVCTLDNLGKGAVDSAFDNVVLMLGHRDAAE
jgi:N-acetyl-gamma-glutamylphosphate reductase